MNDSEFSDIYESTIEAIQNSIDDNGLDIDYEESGGVLTLEFENGSKLIFSKQAPVKQLWLAARTGGFHFDYSDDDQQWVCDSGDAESLNVMVNKLVTEALGEPVTLDF